MIDYKNEYLEWYKSEFDKQRHKKLYRKRFIGSRGYPHFDTPINLFSAEQMGKLEHLLLPNELLNWKFLPFIRNDQRNRRYRHKPDEPSPLKHRNQKQATHIKSRPIMYASHHDACLFAFLNFILNKPYEAELAKRKLANNVIAYRSIERSNNVTFAKKAFDYMEEQPEFACLLIDVKSFFDTVPHKGLLGAIAGLLDQKIDQQMQYVLANILNYRFVIEDEVIKEMKRNKQPYHVPIGAKAVRLCKIEDYNRYIDNRKFIRKNAKSYGFPQGSPVSGLLANIYLLEFDDWLTKRLSAYKIKLYQRYSDDMLIVSPTGEIKDLYAEIKKELSSLGLALSTNKTELFIKSGGSITNELSAIEPSKSSSRQKMQYLGLEWDGKQIVLRPSTIAKRLRPKNKLARKYWRYHEQAIKKVGQKAIQKQYVRARRSIKKKESN